MTRYAYALIVAALLAGCNGGGSTASSNTPAAANNQPTAATQPDLAKLETKDTVEGTGTPAKTGDTLIVLYIGKFRSNGEVFDSNMDENLKPLDGKDPLSLVLGAGSVIQGWEEGLVGVKEGTVREIDIPWSKGYGKEGDGRKIPPMSDLKFTVKVLKIYRAGEQPEIDATDIVKGNGKPVTETSTIVMTYKGSTAAGKVFDDETKKPLTVPVSRLIPGFKEAIIGMKPGGKRKISWPPGAPNPTGLIPPNQPVEYVVEILEVK